MLCLFYFFYLLRVDWQAKIDFCRARSCWRQSQQSNLIPENFPGLAAYLLHKYCPMPQKSIAESTIKSKYPILRSAALVIYLPQIFTKF